MYIYVYPEMTLANFKVWFILRYKDNMDKSWKSEKFLPV